MKDIIVSLFSFLFIAAFIGFAIWFGAALLVFIFISSFFLAAFIFLRGYYLRWKYKDSYGKNFSDAVRAHEEKIHDVKTTIIDVEYSEVKKDNNDNNNDNKKDG